jgi:hypothetical protein
MIDNSERRYQIFVSSTFRDLQAERERVAEAILELEGFPAGMELFPAANDRQWEFIKRQIEASDYYVLIIGGRYGSLAPDGVSYTEKEYDFAIKLKIPVMAFLSQNLETPSLDQQETEPHLRERLLNFRKKAAAGKLVKFFSSADELKVAVWQALTYAFSHEHRPGWTRAQIPPRSNPKLPVRSTVGGVLKELEHTSKIIDRLIYVVMPMDNAFMSRRFRVIAAECERLNFVAVHLREVAQRVPDPLETLHDLIGQANLVIFDVSRPDADVAYQLGYQRGLGDIPKDGILLLTDDATTLSVSYAPFDIEPISSESVLRAIVRDRLQGLLEEMKKKT